MIEKKHVTQIALLFNANKVYDRGVMEGIGEYIQASDVQWNIYVEDEFIVTSDTMNNWHGDGIIADFDDIEIQKYFKGSTMPIVGVGSSYENEDDYPQSPYVATDNYSVVNNAFVHLKDKGITDFAFYGLPNIDEKRWAIERENIFKKIMVENNHNFSIYRGHKTNAKTWKYDMNRLTDWLQRLPKATGVICVTDARARHILQACDNAGIIIPDDLSIIGVDNDHTAQNLTRISLSSVNQDCKKIGFEAAKMLHKIIDGNPPRKQRVIVKASEIHERQSSLYQAIRDPYVIKAMHFIRTHIKKGIKVNHVLDALRMSRSNLDARFKTELGYTIHHEIHQSRLNLACSALQYMDLSITEIYKMCGYQSLQYMYSVFVKSLGVTPKEYRHGNKNITE